MSDPHYSGQSEEARQSTLLPSGARRHALGKPLAGTHKQALCHRVPDLVPVYIEKQ